MEQTFLIKNLIDLKKIAYLLVDLIKPNSYFLFFGKIGVGKTQLIKFIFEILQIKEVIFSPSFIILHQIKSKNLIFNHFDFYRLDCIHKNDQELNLYFEDMIDNVNFIEWPKIIETKILKINYNLKVKIYLDFNSSNPEFRNCKIIWE